MEITNKMIREKIEELYPIIEPHWSDEDIIDFIKEIWNLIPDEDLEENQELINELKVHIRNKKIDNIINE